MSGGRIFKVLYFGLLAERRGLAEENVTSAASSPADLYQELDAEYRLGLSTGSFRVAVNDEFANWDDVISNEDTIAFLPPMSGG